MFYGDMSNKIHANLDYHYMDMSFEGLLEYINILTHRVLMRIGIFVEKMTDQPKRHFISPETDKENKKAYKELFLKEFSAGEAVEIKMDGYT